MDSRRDYYAVLGVAPHAEPAVIRAAYRALSQAHHPDKAGPGQKEEATRRMAEINEAYDVLGDPERRRAYDERRRTGRTWSDSTGPTASVAPRLSGRGRLVFGSLTAVTILIAMALGIEEKSALRVAVEFVLGGFAMPVRYEIHWSSIVFMLFIGVAISYRVARIIAGRT